MLGAGQVLGKRRDRPGERGIIQFGTFEVPIGNPSGEDQGTLEKGRAEGHRCIWGVVDLEAVRRMT